MFPVKFLLQIHSCFASSSGRDVWMERTIPAIPFPPSKEIDIAGIEMEVQQIVWDPETESFTCYCEDKELYNAALHFKPGQYDQEYLDRRLAELVSEYEDYGWSKERK